MELYHVSKEIVQYPEVRKARYTKDFSWGFKYPTHQISFHTLSALDCLTFVKSEVVYDREGKK